MPQERQVLQVPRRELERRHVELGEEVGAGNVECGRKEGEAEFACIPLKRDVFVAAELEKLAMLAVGAPKAVLVIVGALVHLGRVQRPVIALLQLDSLDTAFACAAEQLSRLLEIALVVV